MSAEPVPVNFVALDKATSSPGVWDRITKYVSEHKAVVYATAAAVIVVGAGGVYYLHSKSSDGSAPSPKPTKKQRRAERKQKHEERLAEEKDQVEVEEKPTKVEEVAQTLAEDTKVETPAPTVATPEPVAGTDGLPEITEESVAAMTPEQRAEFAAQLKSAGNKAYQKKEFETAITCYSRAIICKADDPVFWSNRAACYAAKGDHQKVIEDTTAALKSDSMYIKALNRRAVASEALGRNEDALLDFTASCIMDGFTNQTAQMAIERLLKKVAEEEAAQIWSTREQKLPSPTFVNAYMDAFRKKDAPVIESADPESGDAKLKAAIEALEHRDYENSMNLFDEAIEKGCSHLALAYSWKGTFEFIMGNAQKAMEYLDKSTELDPALVQNYVKRASVHMELGEREKTWDDFDKAIEVNAEDPDIYYHRGQVRFITGEYAAAAKDYQRSIDLDKNFVFSHVQLGVAQYKLGSIASSMATFRRCIKQFGDTYSEVHNYYGELLMDQQRFEDALEKFDRAIELEKAHTSNMNVLPLINKALVTFQWKKDVKEATVLCEKALAIDPSCDVAVATMAQLLLQQGKTREALEYFEKSAELARTPAELVNALSYKQATKVQLQIVETYPQLAEKLAASGAGMM
ncbi:TOM (translocase of outer membrane) complex component [Saitoella coloradoensis]